MAPATARSQGRRDLKALPKAHLHLHFTGGMRHATMVEFADDKGMELTSTLRDGPPPLGGGERGWGRFQRLYDIARSTIQTRSDVRRVVQEIVEDDRSAGSGWLELQIDPTSYAERFGGLNPTIELVLESASGASAATGVGVGVIVAANRTRDPRIANTLARLAARYAVDGVVGFGLSNDERAGAAEDFVQAFRIAERAGLLNTPHGGELLGPESVHACIHSLKARRVGHAVAAAGCPATLELMADRDVAAEVCPTSNVALGVALDHSDVPVRTLFDAGVPVALGADDPLLFGAGLVEQYQTVRDLHGFSDEELAALASQSVTSSAAPADRKAVLLAGVAAWLAEPAP